MLAIIIIIFVLVITVHNLSNFDKLGTSCAPATVFVKHQLALWDYFAFSHLKPVLWLSDQLFLWLPLAPLCIPGSFCCLLKLQGASWCFGHFLKGLKFPTRDNDSTVFTNRSRSSNDLLQDEVGALYFARGKWKHIHLHKAYAQNWVTLL